MSYVPPIKSLDQFGKANSWVLGGLLAVSGVIHFGTSSLTPDTIQNGAQTAVYADGSQWPGDKVVEVPGDCRASSAGMRMHLANAGHALCTTVLDLNCCDGYSSASSDL